MKKYRAHFLTVPSPEAAGALRGWLDSGNEIAEVWFPKMTNQGRLHRDQRLAWLAPRWSVAALAKRHGFKIRTVPTLVTWEGIANEVRQVGADVLISVLFSYRVPADVLAIFDSPEFGNRAVNIHPAPLPQYRGPHPYHSLILDGVIKENACVTLHVMEAGFDTGDIIAARPVSFPHDGSLTRYGIEVGRAAGKLLLNDLPNYLSGALKALPQDPELADYRTIDGSEFVLGPNVALKAAILFCQTFGGISTLDVHDIDDAEAIGIAKVLGAPTGRPPVKRYFGIETDLADARVRLRRKMPWTSPMRKLGSLWVRIFAH